VTSSERRQAVLAILNARDGVRVADLAARLQVSDVTIRKDLALLEEQGYVKRTHGGAVPAERFEPEHALPTRHGTNRDRKAALARRARALVSHGETIFIDSGSTCAAFAGEITDMELRVVTNSLDVLTILADRPNISLLVVGGSYRHDAGSFIGPWAERSLGTVQFDHAFIGATGISLEGRFSAQNGLESQVKSAAIAVARTSIVIADGSKIGVQAFSVFAGPGEITTLVTDGTEEQCRPLEETGLHVIRLDDQIEDLKEHS
jgi:DeoR/GlpR family transcriptional regulator of sugar metabolism